MKIYLAGPIFCYGDLLRNIEWAKKIRDHFPGVDLYSPVENTDINGVEGKKKFAGSQEIAQADNARLNNTDILVACIDGDVLPSGTSAEIGKFHEKIERGEHKYIVGICTDNRQMYLTHSDAKNVGGAAALGEQQYSYQNLYVTGLIKQGGILVSNIEDAIEFIKEKCAEFGQEYVTYEDEPDYEDPLKYDAIHPERAVDDSLIKTISVEKNNLNNLNLEPIKCPICQSPHVIVTVHSLMPNKDLTSVSYNCLSCGHGWLQNDEAKTKE